MDMTLRLVRAGGTGGHRGIVWSMSGSYREEKPSPLDWGVQGRGWEYASQEDPATGRDAGRTQLPQPLNRSLSPLFHVSGACILACITAQLFRPQWGRNGEPGGKAGSL